MRREELLEKWGEPVQVLDKGHVRLVDVMGDDSSICQAARISYGAGTKSVSEDEGLIRYLMRNYHTTPLEMCEIKLHVRVPMDCWRQWIRHRMVSVNEYSTRYSEAINDRQGTEMGEWRLQSGTNKQGSGGMVTEWPDDLHEWANAQLSDTPGEFLSTREREFQEHAQSVYLERLQFGVAREQARKDLPLSTYTEAYWKVDLHNLFHFLRLRMDSHAQLEIRQYANVIAEVVKDWVPAAWKAFEDYRLEAKTFSRMEMKLLRDLARQVGDRLEQPINDKTGWSSWIKELAPEMSQRERKEFREALGVEF